MFDKNTFKETFRSWAENNPNATPEEAQDFCRKILPLEALVQNHWLIEQSVSWYAWAQEQRALRKASEDRSQDDLLGESGQNYLM